MNCPNCQFEVASNWRLCPNCGTSLEGKPRGQIRRRQQERKRTPLRNTSLEEERRIVTVLFADISGFTSLSELIDPEELKGLMDECFLSMSRTIQSYGGYVDKYLGDAIMAIFGAPEAHEDDAERAARAAIAIRDSISSLSTEPLLRSQKDIHRLHHLQVRIGLSTGEVVTGSPAGGRAHDYTVLGDTVNVAKRLQESAQPGTIMISQTTRRLIPRYFITRSTSPLQLKGKKQLVNAYVLEGISEELPSLSEIPRDIPFVGRERELDCLLSLLRESLRNRRPQLITISGEAGIGKSRLLREFLKRAADEFPNLIARIGHCPHFGETVFAPFREIIRSHFAIPPGSDASAIARINEVLLQHPEFSASRSIDFSSLTFPIASLGGFDVPREFQTTSPEESRQQLFWAAKRFFESLGRTAPAVIAIEDAHTADPSSLDLAAHIAESCTNSALNVILIVRDEFHDKFMNWQKARSNNTILKLGPLPPDDIRTIIRTFLDIPTTSRLEAPTFVRSDITTIQKVITEKSAGNPLFIEKLLENFIDEKILVKKSSAGKEQWHLTTTIEDIRVPETLYGAIASRLDRLPPYHKRILQRAAVVGRVFSKNILEYLMSGEYQDTSLLDQGGDCVTIRSVKVFRSGLERELRHLESAGFIERCHQPHLIREQTSVRGDIEYMFREPLTQDLAYNSLFKKARRQLHRLAAEWIERNFASQLQNFFPMLARHYREAGEILKAIHYHEKSGDAFVRSYSLPEAFHHYSHAISLLETMQTEGVTALPPTCLVQSVTDDERESDASRTHESLMAEIYSKHARILYLMGRPQESLKYIESGLSIARRIRDARAEVRLLSHLSNIYRHMGDLESAFTSAQKALEAISTTVASSSIPEAIVTDVLLEMVTINILRGAYDEALALALKAAQISRDAHDKDNEAEATNRIGAIHFYKGNYSDALQCYQQCYALYSTTKSKPDIASILNNMATLYYTLGQYEQALATCEEAINLWAEIGNPWGMAAALSNIALAHKARGENKEALNYRLQALEIAREIGDQYIIANNLNSIGGIHLDLGDYEQAQKYFEEALEIRKNIHDREGIATTLANIGTTYYKKGLFEDALAHIKSALRIHEEIGSTRMKLYALNTAANIYTDLACYDYARTCAQEALTLAQRVKLLREEAESLLALGSCLSLIAQYQEAQVHFERALSIAEKLGATDLHVLASLGIAETTLRIEDSPETRNKILQISAKARRTAEELSRPSLITEALITEAHVLSILGQDFSEALAKLESLVSAPMHASQARKCHNILARLHFLRGDCNKAQIHLNASRTATALVASFIKDPSLKKSFLDRAATEEPHDCG